MNNIIKNTKNQIEIDDIWKNKIQKDYYFTFRDKQKGLIKSINNIKQLSIKLPLYKFDFSKWKMISKEGFENYDTGKLIYFQIKFLYEHLQLIPNENQNNFYLLIDEPELFLHPSLKRHVGFLLKQINKKINVIITTHSSELLNSFFQIGLTKIFNKKQNAKNWQTIELQEKKINNFINRKVYFEILISKKIIICEGNNDMKLLNYIINNYDNTEKDVLVLSTLKHSNTGKSAIPNIYNLIKDVKFDDKDIFIIYDKDLDKASKSNDNNSKYANYNKIINDLKSRKKSLLKKNIYGFKNNLETYFNILNKSAWDEYDFFNNLNNKDKLDTFLEKSYLYDFLKVK